MLAEQLPSRLRLRAAVLLLDRGWRKLINPPAGNVVSLRTK
jgi:hypothetical protein